MDQRSFDKHKWTKGRFDKHKWAEGRFDTNEWAEGRFDKNEWAKGRFDINVHMLSRNMNWAIILHIVYMTSVFDIIHWAIAHAHSCVCR